MLWTIEKIDASHDRRAIQPQSFDEYSALCRTFPDPQVPSTHTLTYRWIDGPTPRHPRRIVFEPQVKGKQILIDQGNDPPAKLTVAPGPAADALEKQEAAKLKLDDVERRIQTLTAMSPEDFATEYAVAGLGSLPKKLSRAQAGAQIIEREAKA